MTYPPQHSPYPAPPRPPKKPVWPWVVGLSGLFVVVIVVTAVLTAGIQAARDRAVARGTSPTPTSAAASERAQAQAPPSTSTTAPPTTTGPVTQVTEGTFEAGVDIVPGKYKGRCDGAGYWAIQRSTDPTDIVSNEFSPKGGLMQFEVKKGQYVRTHGCTFDKV